MRSLAPVARYVLWLLCAVILITRISGAHMHLCFDGTEPLVSVHAEESRHDVGHELSNRGHSDLEVSLGGDALFKKTFVAGDLTIALLAALAVLMIGAIDTPKVARPRASPVLLSRAFLLHPPLRGPPR
jgi:hypothetical protein